MLLVPRSLQDSHLLGNKSGKVSAEAPYRYLNKGTLKDAMQCKMFWKAHIPARRAPRDENARHRRGLQGGLVDLVARRPLVGLGAHPVLAGQYEGGVGVLRALVLHPCNLLDSNGVWYCLFWSEASINPLKLKIMVKKFVPKNVE